MDLCILYRLRSFPLNSSIKILKKNPNFFFHIPVCLSIAIYFLPESPVWLRSKHRFQEADSSVQWLKLHEPAPHTPPLSTISDITTVESIENKTTNANIIENTNNEAMSAKVLFTRPVLLPLSIGLVLLIIQQVSGIDAIIFFTVEIFRASGIYNLNQESKFEQELFSCY